jgi:hypothetical protein
MRRALAILFLLLTLAACASQRLPATQGVPAPDPAPAARLHGLIIYARAIKTSPDTKHLQSDLAVVDEHGRLLHTLPLTNVLYGLELPVPNKAIYSTLDGLFLVDAAHGSVAHLPITRTNALRSLSVAKLNDRWLLLTDQPRGDWDTGPHASILVDLEGSTAIDLNILLKSRDRLPVVVSPDNQTLLAFYGEGRVAMIPSAHPAQWREVAYTDWLSSAGATNPAQALIYRAGQSTPGDSSLTRHAGDLLLIHGADGQPALLNSRSDWTAMNDPHQILLHEKQGLVMLNLTTGERRNLNRCADAHQIIMSDTDERFLCSAGYGMGWQFIDLSAGSATPLPDLEGSTPLSSTGQRWAVFGVQLVGSRRRDVPISLVDLHTGRIVTSLEKSRVLDIAPDGSAVLVADYSRYQQKNIWLMSSDGTNRLIYDRPREADVRFSPDGQQIIISNTRAETWPMVGSVRVIDRTGQVVLSLERFGVAPLWLKH